MSNFKLSLATLVVTIAIVCIGAVAIDAVAPQFPCTQFETNHWKSRPGAFSFERVSIFYWSSLCAPNSKPVVISASEGTGPVRFSDIAFANWGVVTHEFRGAHRGLKTSGYILSHSIHPTRRKNLRVLALVNPVYFSFAASTDAASIRRVAISNLSYMLRGPFFRQKWDEFIFESPLIAFKSVLAEVQLFKTARAIKLQTRDTPLPKPIDYDFDRNIYRDRQSTYTSFRSDFSATREPSRTLLDNIVTFIREHPEVPICVVMLPVNTKNLQHFGKDVRAVEQAMDELVEILPEVNRVDLSALNGEPYIFVDPMHLTDYGKLKVMQAVYETPCGQRVLGTSNPL